jgi:GTP pyrophosphokinase
VAKLKDEYILEHLKEETSFRIKNLDEFYAHIGVGKIILTRKLMEKLFPEETLTQKKQPLIKKVVTRVTKRPPSAIQVKDIETSIINLAKCCSPIRGEPIVGYITSGKGVTVHSLRCPLIKREVLASDRMVEVLWDESTKGMYKATLNIKGEDSPGVLANLTAAIAQLEGNITKANVNTTQDKKGHVKLTLDIRDIKHLNSIIKKISSIKEISSVERI